MCFTRKNETAFAKIAAQDIFAFKILTKRLCSPSRGTQWTLGNYKTEPDFNRIMEGSDYSIHKGLHCCKTLKDARYYNKTTYSCRDYRIFPVKIPKGSLYWENDTQIVSDTMVLTSTKHYLKNGTLSKN
jgi:hypothetical protein